MIPLLILRLNNNIRSFLTYYIVSVLLLAFIFSDILSLYISLTVLLPVLVMGRMYHKHEKAFPAIVSGVIVLIAEVMVGIYILFLSGISIAQEIEQFFNENMMEALPEQFMGMLSPEMVSMYASMIAQLIPLFVVLYAVTMITLVHAIAKQILKKIGMPYYELKPVREWMLPRSFVLWYFLFYVIYLFSSTDNNQLSYFLLNIMSLAMITFSIQAISFFMFIARNKRWAKVIPFLVLCVMLIFPLIIMIISLVGLLDTAFPIRKQLKK